MSPLPLWIGRSVRAAILAATTGTGLWGLSQHPFAQPLVERGAASASRIIEKGFRDTFTPDWVDQAITRAVQDGNQARVLWLADLAETEGLALPPATSLQIEAIRERADSWTEATGDCISCAIDIAQCTSLAHVAACALPFEMSPLGDINALRRQAVNAMAGDEIDRLETGLALAGLAATGAVIVTAGGSGIVKAGTATLRAARRMGSLTPGLARVLGDAADLPISWTAVGRAAPIDEITDIAKLERLGRIGQDVGTIARRTSAAEALVLLRHVDSAEDAARLARMSEVTGTRTLSRIEVLGKARSFRALVRASDLAIATLLAIWAAVMQLGLMLTGWFASRLARAASRGPRPSRMARPDIPLSRP